MTGKIDKSEMLSILLIAIFGTIWVLGVLPQLSANTTFLSYNPVAQYIIYNVGFIVMTTAIFGGILSHFMKHKFDIMTAVRSGLASWLGFSFIIDMWQPPLYLSQTGQVLITSQSALPQTAVDAMMSYVGTSIGIAASTMMYGFSELYIFVYYVTPIIAGIMMAFLLAPKEFRRFLNIS